MENEQLIKDLSNWFGKQIKKCARDLGERCEVMDIEGRTISAIIGTELLALTAEIFARGTSIDTDDAGKMFADGVRLIREREAAKKKEATNG